MGSIVTDSCPKRLSLGQTRILQPSGEQIIRSIMHPAIRSSQILKFLFEPSYQTFAPR